jgi:hypothetical protein
VAERSRRGSVDKQAQHSSGAVDSLLRVWQKGATLLFDYVELSHSGLAWGKRSSTIEGGESLRESFCPSAQWRIELARDANRRRGWPGRRCLRTRRHRLPKAQFTSMSTVHPHGRGRQKSLLPRALMSPRTGPALALAVSFRVELLRGRRYEIALSKKCLSCSCPSHAGWGLYNRRCSPLVARLRPGLRHGCACAIGTFRGAQYPILKSHWSTG